MRRLLFPILGLLFAWTIVKAENIMHQLFEEYVEWYRTMARGYERLPRSISGISENGTQFIFILDGFTFDHAERHKFIKAILEAEQASVFVYATLAAAYDEDKNTLSEELLSRLPKVLSHIN